MDVELARFNMVEQQIRPWDVLDQEVLDLLLRVRRERFVPPAYASLAFADMEIPLGHGEFMLSPKLEARMLQELAPGRGDSVLEIGTGSGYFTALLAHRAAAVRSVEIVPELHAAARARLAAEGVHNATLERGDAAAGWAGGPWDCVAFTGSVPVLPPAWLDALKPGGRLIAIVGDAPVMKAMLYQRSGSGIRAKELFETSVPPLRNAVQPETIRLLTHGNSRPGPFMKLLPALVLALATLSDASGADLLQIYREAQDYDSTLAAARAAYRAGVERVPQARAALGPQAQFNASTTLNTINRKGAAPFVPGGTSTGLNAAYQLTLSQSLYRKGDEITVEQARTQVSALEAQLAAAEQDLVLRVAQAYFDVLLAQDNVALSGAQKRAIGEQLAQAKRNFEVGTATIVDTHDAQARYDLAAAKEISDQNDLEIRKRALETLIGKPMEPLAILRDKVDLPLPQPNDIAQWVTTAENQNLQVLQARAAAAIGSQEIERQRASYGPNIDLVSSFTDSGNSADKQKVFGGEPKTLAIGVQLAIPLWDSGLRDARIREARASADRSLQDLETARRAVGLQARQAFIGVTSGVAQIRALQQSLISSQSSLDSTKLGQQVGVRTGVDVLNAQQQLFQARRDLSAARYTTIVNELRLKSAAGNLTETDLLEVNLALDSKR